MYILNNCCLCIFPPRTLLGLPQSFTISYFILALCLTLIVTCPKCGHTEAFYMQIQTRSADEPMTIYYKCCNFSCGFRWKE